MSPDTEAQCLFLNQLGSRVSDNNPKATAMHRHCSAPNASVEEIKNETRGQYCFPSLALFGILPTAAAASTSTTTSEQQRRTGTQYDFRKNAEEPKSGAASRSPKECALRHLSAPVRYHAADVHGAPSEMANRALDSFAFLVAANLRQFFAIQRRRHRHGRSSEACAAKAKHIASFFLDGTTTGGCGSKPIDIVGGSTSFYLEEGEDEDCDRDLGAGPQCIVFHMNVDLCILGCKVSIPMKTVGQLEATFATSTGRIIGANVTLEMNQLLLSMRTQARLVVLKAVAKKGFPVMHTDSPVTILHHSTADSGDNTARTNAPSGNKMTKLAICASLELAATINDSSPLSLVRSEVDSQERVRVSSTGKRRLGAAMGAGALFVLPGSKKRLMGRAPLPLKIAGKFPASLGQVVPNMVGQLVHQS